MPQANRTGSDRADRDTTPWWKYKMLWLVIGGPLAVVIASFVTLGLALKHPDEVLKTPQATTRGAASGDAAAYAPAMQARNHAATGGAAPAGK